MDDVKILKDMFDDGEKPKIENIDDWFFTYFRIPYRIVKFYIPDFLRNVKYIFQKIFRKHHCSDPDLWNLDYSLARIILPKLKAFRARDIAGHPMAFCEWTDEEDLGLTKEEYDKKRNDGEFLGGQHEGWLAAIDEMIFAFEYLIYSDGFDKKAEAFYQKYGYKYPYRNTDDNLSWSYNYSTPDDGHMSTSELVDLNDEQHKGYKLLGKYKSYVDLKTIKEAGERAQKGFDLFGRFFMNLWD